MYVINRSDNVHTMLQMYRAVSKGVRSNPRGSECRNVHNLAAIFDLNQPVITSFRARNFNLKYAKQEWLWYLRGNKFDSSIEQYATMWKKLQQPDGSYYSNYGQYIFGSNGDKTTQFGYVIETLKADPDSRRASITLLQPHHLFAENTDVVCTYAINFTIEDCKLNMTVMMRSNDVIFGFTNDAFCFTQLYILVFKILEHKYSWLLKGTYTHFTNSMHVYDRHFKMISEIVEQGYDGYENLPIPLDPSYDECVSMIVDKGVVINGAYSAWLKAE